MRRDRAEGGRRLIESSTFKMLTPAALESLSINNLLNLKKLHLASGLKTLRLFL